MHLARIFMTIIITGFCFSCTHDLHVNGPGNLVPKTVDQDSSLPYITVNNIRLHSEAFGNPDSPLIIVLHGGPGGDYRYLMNCKGFSEYGYRVVFYDQGGTGLSHRFPKTYYKDLQLVFDELTGVIAFYKKHAKQKVFLLGHSWGGMMAAAYVNQYPEEITGLILGEPGGFIWQDILTYINNSVPIKITSEALNDNTYIDQFLTARKKDEHQLLDYKYAIQSASEGQNDIPVTNKEVAPIPFWRFGAINNLGLIEMGEKVKPDWTTNLQAYSAKVLFIYSQNNKAYGQAWAKHVSSAFKNVELFEVLNVGHNMFSFQTGWNNSFQKMLGYLKSL